MTEDKQHKHADLLGQRAHAVIFMRLLKRLNKEELEKL